MIKILWVSVVASINALDLSTRTIPSDGKCRALVLSGGGTKGAYEVGVLNAMVEFLPAEEVAYDVVAGVSIGAIAASTIATFPIGREKDALEKLNKQWQTNTVKDILEMWPYLGPIEAVWRPSFFDSTYLRN